MPGISASSSRSSSNSQSTSSSFGQSGSKSDSYQTGRSEGGSTTRQSIAFEDLYRGLFGSASQAAGVAARNVPALQGKADMLFSSGIGFLEELEGPLSTEGRLNDKGVDDELIASLGSDLGRFYDEEIGTRITGQGVSSGTLGGSRGEVAKGIAGRGLAEEFARKSLDIRKAGVDRRDRLASSVDSLKAGKIDSGIAGVQDLYGLSQAGANAELEPYLKLAQILGGKSTLTTGDSFSSSLSAAVSRARAASEQGSESQSTSMSKSTSKSAGGSFI